MLRTLKAQDVEPDAPQFDYDSFTSRNAVRAIVFDGPRVALLKVNLHGYYMLPGGGIDDGEDQYLALAREAQEELGCEVKVTSEVGSATIYNDRWKKKQTDFCYTVQLVHDTSNKDLTDFEIEEGHELIWAESISDAIKLMQGAVPKVRDGKLVRARDLIFLKTARDVTEEAS